MTNYYGAGNVPNLPVIQSDDAAIDKRSVDELIAEIERLKSEIGRRKPTCPIPVATPDFTYLRKMIIDAVTEAAETKHWPKELKQYVYEIAVKSVYGQEFFVWFKSVKWNSEE